MGHCTRGTGLGAAVASGEGTVGRWIIRGERNGTTYCGEKAGEIHIRSQDDEGSPILSYSGTRPQRWVSAGLLGGQVVEHPGDV